MRGAHPQDFGANFGLENQRGAQGFPRRPLPPANDVVDRRQREILMVQVAVPQDARPGLPVFAPGDETAIVVGIAPSLRGADASLTTAGAQRGRRWILLPDVFHVLQVKQPLA